MGPGISERHGGGGSPGHRAAGAAGTGGDVGDRSAVAGGGGGRGVALGVRAVVGSLLAAAMRGLSDDGEAEAHAVAAFRAARDGGAHTAPTRRRDDWRHRRSAGATGIGGNAGRPGGTVAAADCGVPDTEPVAVEAAVVTTEGTGAAGAAGVPRQAGPRTD
ncbi:hypothetical protein ACIRQH_27715 [Streptomyces sp. NPDC102279]|uniref:hypothetical protein n=1 Tax=Streptomyces sp. NPDC102279 TaxID=3366153 RepID=UPI00381D0AFA